MAGRQTNTGHSLVLYDAQCDFCVWLLAILLRWDRARRLEPIALQRAEADDLLHALTPPQRAASWHLISPAGERRSGGAALAPVLWLLPGGWPPALILAWLPRCSERGYRWVAAHRIQLSRLVSDGAKRRARALVGERESR